MPANSVKQSLNTSKFATLATMAFFLTIAVPPTRAQAPATPVELDQVRLVAVEETAAIFGQLISKQAGTVAAAVSAPVASLHVSVGDRVERDDLIASLDDSTHQLQRARVQARSEVSDWAIKRASLEVQLKAQQEERLALLRHSAATTEAQHEDAVLLLESARNALGEAKASSELVLRELELEDHSLSLTQIKAPYSGVIVEKFIEVGEYARVGDRIVRMVADRQLEIEAYIPYRYIDSFQVGDSVSASFDNGTTFDATVRAFIPEEHASTRTRAVRLTFDLGQDSQQSLAINQNVTINVPTSRMNESLSVHKDAIISQGDGHLVYVVSEEDTASPRPIVIGDAVGNRFEVISGLESGESVVIRGNERLTPGQKVRVVG